LERHNQPQHSCNQVSNLTSAGATLVSKLKQAAATQ